jgi:hypothetical protein
LLHDFEHVAARRIALQGFSIQILWLVVLREELIDELNFTFSFFNWPTAGDRLPKTRIPKSEKHKIEKCLLLVT